MYEHRKWVHDEANDDDDDDVTSTNLYQTMECPLHDFVDHGLEHVRMMTLNTMLLGHPGRWSDLGSGKRDCQNRHWTRRI